jgi:hypothetical protein
VDLPEVLGDSGGRLSFTREKKKEGFRNTSAPCPTVNQSDRSISLEKTVWGSFCDRRHFGRSAKHPNTLLGP